MTPEKIVKNFNRCSDWEERYLYLIELGKRLPEYPQEKLTDKYLVAGCQSQVWLHLDKVSNTELLSFQASSDTAIVKGLLALMRIAYHQRTTDEVLAFDIEFWFSELALRDHLTSIRSTGLAAIVLEVRQRVLSI